MPSSASSSQKSTLHRSLRIAKLRLHVFMSLFASLSDISIIKLRGSIFSCIASLYRYATGYCLANRFMSQKYQRLYNMLLRPNIMIPLDVFNLYKYSLSLGDVLTPVIGKLIRTNENLFSGAILLCKKWQFWEAVE